MSATVTELDSRRATLGGSRIAAAAGIDPWCSRVELYYRMSGVIADDEGEQLWWGTVTQPLIFEALAKRGYLVEETPHLELTDELYPWFVGHPDGIERDETVNIVEAKLTGRYSYRHGDELPLAWQAQVQTYMLAAQAPRALLAVNVGGIRLDVTEVEYDERAASRLLELGGEFMECLRSGTPPAPDGSESARKALGYVFPSQTPGRKYRLLADEWEAAKKLREWREVERHAKERVREYENIVKAAAGDAETIITPHDTTFATWKTVEARRLDTKQVRERYPWVYDKCAPSQPQRRFVVND